MKQRKSEKLPMDSELRAQTLRVIEAYKTKKSTNAEGSVQDVWSELALTVMKSISDFIVAYDNNELNAAQQRALFRNMRKLLAKYPA